MINYSDVLLVIILAFPTASLAVTIGKTKIFAGFRNLAKERYPWLGSLVSCPYCLSHWLAGALVLAYQPRIIEPPIFILGWLLTIFLLIALSAPLIWLIRLSLGNPYSSDNETVLQLREALEKAKAKIIELSNKK